MILSLSVSMSLSLPPSGFELTISHVFLLLHPMPRFKYTICIAYIPYLTLPWNAGFRTRDLKSPLLTIHAHASTTVWRLNRNKKKTKHSNYLCLSLFFSHTKLSAQKKTYHSIFHILDASSGSLSRHFGPLHRLVSLVLPHFCCLPSSSSFLFQLFS